MHNTGEPIIENPKEACIAENPKEACVAENPMEACVAEQEVLNDRSVRLNDGSQACPNFTLLHMCRCVLVLRYIEAATLIATGSLAW